MITYLFSILVLFCLCNPSQAGWQDSYEGDLARRAAQYIAEATPLQMPLNREAQVLYLTEDHRDAGPKLLLSNRAFLKRLREAGFTHLALECVRQGNQNLLDQFINSDQRLSESARTNLLHLLESEAIFKKNNSSLLGVYDAARAEGFKLIGLELNEIKTKHTNQLQEALQSYSLSHEVDTRDNGMVDVIQRTVNRGGKVVAFTGLAHGLTQPEILKEKYAIKSQSIYVYGHTEDNGGRTVIQRGIIGAAMLSPHAGFISTANVPRMAERLDGVMILENGACGDLL